MLLICKFDNEMDIQIHSPPADLPLQQMVFLKQEHNELSASLGASSGAGSALLSSWRRVKKALLTLNKHEVECKLIFHGRPPLAKNCCLSQVHEIFLIRS